MLVYIARSANGNTDVEHVYQDHDAAVRDALYLFRNLTPRERRNNIVSVETYDLPIEQDGRTLEEIWRDAVMDDMQETHNPIEYMEVEEAIMND